MPPTPPCPPGVPPRSAARARWALALVFVALLGAFAAGLWGTLLRPAAYEVRGELVARPSPDTILVRHDAVTGLGMTAMELMAVAVPPGQRLPPDLEPGARVRLAVRPRGDDLVLVWIERVP